MEILIDTNTYLRIAGYVYPLLNIPFGKNNEHCIYIIKEIVDEFKNSPRLQHKFHWLNNEKYKKEREDKSSWIRLTKLQKGEVKRNFLFMKEASKDMDITPSMVDITVVSVAYVKEIPVVSDDEDVISLCSEFEVSCWSTIKLLRFMLDNEKLKMDEINDIINWWDKNNDLPCSIPEFKSQYKKIFGLDADKFLEFKVIFR